MQPGSIIHTDMWAAYNGLNQLGYQHRTVNHTLHFVDPQTSVHTNHVEGMWQKAKAKFKSQMGSTNREMIPDYLSEFMWVQRFRENKYFHFWHQIATQVYVL